MAAHETADNSHVVKEQAAAALDADITRDIAPAAGAGQDSAGLEDQGGSTIEVPESNSSPGKSLVRAPFTEPAAAAPITLKTGRVVQPVGLTSTIAKVHFEKLYSAKDQELQVAAKLNNTLRSTIDRMEKELSMLQGLMVEKDAQMQKVHHKWDLTKGEVESLQEQVNELHKRDGELDTALNANRQTTEELHAEQEVSENLRRQVEDLEGQLEHWQKRCAEKIEEAATVEAQLSSTVRTFQERTQLLESRLVERDAAFEALTQEHETMQTTLTSRITQLESEMVDIKKREYTAIETAQAKTDDNWALRDQHEKDVQDTNLAQQRSDELQEQMGDLQNRLHHTSMELETTRRLAGQQVKDMRDRLQQSNTDRDALTKQLEQMSHTVLQLVEKHRAVEERSEEREKRIAELLNMLETARERTVEANARGDALTARNDALKEDLRSMGAQMRDMRRMLDDSRRQLADSMANRSVSLASLRHSHSAGTVSVKQETQTQSRMRARREHSADMQRTIPKSRIGSPPRLPTRDTPMPPVKAPKLTQRKDVFLRRAYGTEKQK